MKPDAAEHGKSWHCPACNCHNARKIEQCLRCGLKRPPPSVVVPDCINTFEIGPDDIVRIPLKQFDALCAQFGELKRLAPEPAANLVAGDVLPIPLWQFTQRASVLLTDEQRKANPDNALIDFICNAVRLAREWVAFAKGQAVDPAVWRTMESAPADGTFILGYGLPMRDTREGVYLTSWRPFGEGSIRHREYLDGKGPEGGFWYEESGWMQTWKPTHWMPCPPAPQPPTKPGSES